MKLEFHGHDERYIVEQSLMNLFPGEKPVYDPIAPGDDTWCVLSVAESGDTCRAEARLSYRGTACNAHLESPLSGSAYTREGQRRYTVAACFYQAFTALLPQLSPDLRAAGGLKMPPWGMLTGVRPDKPATQALAAGESPQAVQEYLMQHYFVPRDRAALALETGAVALSARQRLSPRDIDLYVGIPFCPTRCVYCSFVSQSVERSLDLLEPYVRALIAEIRAGGAMVEKAHLRPGRSTWAAAPPPPSPPRSWTRCSPRWRSPLISPAARS